VRKAVLMVQRGYNDSTIKPGPWARGGELVADVVGGTPWVGDRGGGEECRAMGGGYVCQERREGKVAYSSDRQKRATGKSKKTQKRSQKYKVWK